LRLRVTLASTEGAAACAAASCATAASTACCPSTSAAHTCRAQRLASNQYGVLLRLGSRSGGGGIDASVLHTKRHLTSDLAGSLAGMACRQNWTAASAVKRVTAIGMMPLC